MITKFNILLIILYVFPIYPKTAEEIKDNARSLRVFEMAMYDPNLPQEIKDFKRTIANNPFNKCELKFFESIDQGDYSKADSCLIELKKIANDDFLMGRWYTTCKKLLAISNNKNKVNKPPSKDFSFNTDSATVYNYFETRAGLHMNCLSMLDSVDKCWFFISDRLVDYHYSKEPFIVELHLQLVCQLIDILINNDLKIIVDTVNFYNFKSCKHKKLNDALYFIMQCYLNTFFNNKPEIDKLHIILIMNDLLHYNHLILEEKLDSVKKLLELDLGTLLAMDSFLSDKDIVTLYKVAEYAELSIERIHHEKNKLIAKEKARKE